MYAVIGHPGLLLSKDVRVMLETTINPCTGLMYGAIGTVKHIIYESGTRPPMLPECIVVQFDNYLGPSVSPDEVNCVPIFPIRTFNGYKSDKSLPLQVSYASTVHRWRGRSINQVYVDFGEFGIVSSRAYVALSCARRLSDVQVSFISQEHAPAIADLNVRRVLLSELRRLKSLAGDHRNRLLYHSDKERIAQEIQDLTEQLNRMQVTFVAGKKRAQADEDHCH